LICENIYNNTLSDQFKSRIEKQKYHTVEKFQNQKENKKNTTLSEQFQNLTEKQKHYNVETVQKSNRKKYNAVRKQHENLIEVQIYHIVGKMKYQNKSKA